MTALRILHVDDEPDIREVVEIALGLDTDLAVQSCGSGGDAIMVAGEWLPDLILLDVMMPGMDGPATLSRLRESQETADIPVIFMTARAQTSELQHFISLGAEGVISKPFDPMTLAISVRRHVRFSNRNHDERRQSFIKRARIDGLALECERVVLTDGGCAALRRIHAIAHSLAGGGGVFGLMEVGNEAFALEAVVSARLGGADSQSDVGRAIDRLAAAINKL